MRKLSYFLVFFLVLGCQQTPFPEKALFSTKEPPKSEYGIDCLDFMEFTEETTSAYPLIAKGPAGSVYGVTAEGLPSGARLSNDPLEFSWTPPVGASVDPAIPTQPFRLYSIRFTVRPSEDGKALFEKSVILKVNPK